MLSKLVVTVFLLLGTASCFPDGRIVNGTDSKISKHPYIVSLRELGSHSCGGCIIAPRWILTSASCMENKEIDTLSIQYGSTDVSPSGPNVMTLKRIIMHEEYDPIYPSSPNLALIELKGQLIFNHKTIAPVTLPEPYFEVEQLDEGVHGILAGWGLSETCGAQMKTLQEVDQIIDSDIRCRKQNSGLMDKRMLCAGFEQGGKGVCTGDGGGPLIHNGILVGVASWGFLPCGLSTSFFTKVSYNVDWIHRHINK